MYRRSYFLYLYAFLFQFNSFPDWYQVTTFSIHANSPTALTIINDFLVPYVSFKLLFSSTLTGQHFYVFSKKTKVSQVKHIFSTFFLMPSIYIYQNHLQLTCNANTYTTSFHFPIFTIPYVAQHITLSISYLILPYADEISNKTSL